MLRRMMLTVFLFSLAAPLPAQQATPSADEVAARTIAMLGGSAWEKARYIAFTFDVERDGKTVASFPQRWDRFTGDYRVAGTDQSGANFVIVMNVNTKQGKAWKNGEAVADPAEMLTTGYRRFINDTYWLLMPLKSMDPGVHREYAGAKNDDCGNSWDVVRLSFDNVGLTPGDQYWMWVNRNTGLVDQWHMKLQSAKPEDQPAVIDFRDFRRIGGLLLSTRREVRGKSQVIHLDDITVSETVPVDAFK